jgi:8-oxo-dGTP diphosphatase
MSSIEVAVAVIIDNDRRVLITRRAFEKSHGGFWEYPGGKLEQNEDVTTALVREIREEIGVEIIASQYLGSIDHSYSDKQVRLIVYLVTQFSGVPSCCESQLDLRWVHYEDLCHYNFPEANHPIIHLISEYTSEPRP